MRILRNSLITYVVDLQRISIERISWLYDWVYRFNPRFLNWNQRLNRRCALNILRRRRCLNNLPLKQQRIKNPQNQTPHLNPNQKPTKKQSKKTRISGMQNPRPKNRETSEESTLDLLEFGVPEGGGEPWDEERERLDKELRLVSTMVIEQT